MQSKLPKTVTARAKVNLTLTVHGRRADGYHELDSLVAFASMGDTVTLQDGAPTVTVTGPFGAAIEGENLVLRALQMVAKRLPHARLGTLTIDKQLPVAAGLGGGSADAAAALVLIRAANPALGPEPAWEQIAAELGSDVPVCLRSHRCRMTGRGETLELLPELPQLHCVLINPRVRVPANKTAQVFGRLAAPPLGALSRHRANPKTADAWLDQIYQSGNDLEGPAIAIIPAIAEVLAAARSDSRTRLARLSGAGPTCFSLTASAQDAHGLAADLVARHPTWWIVPVQLD